MKGRLRSLEKDLVIAVPMVGSSSVRVEKFAFYTHCRLSLIVCQTVVYENISQEELSSIRE